jgi:hypothetical protein
MNDKISGKHLERAAYVYIRQSSLQQVRHNLESSRRQYALQERARELGFAEVVVIDEDLGISGTGHQERPGFGRLLSAVCDGRVGAVLAMEASRLARNNRDWHHLIDLDARVKQAFFIVEPNQAELAEVGRLLDAGELRCFVDAVVPFAEASDAYYGKVKGRRGPAKWWWQFLRRGELTLQ